MEHEGDDDANYSQCTWNGPQRHGKETERNRSQRKNRDHSDKNIFKIGQKTEKHFGVLRRLAITRTLASERPPTNTDGKISKD